MATISSVGEIKVLGGSNTGWVSLDGIVFSTAP